MGLTRDEIIDLASRYTTQDELTDFPFDGDVFCILIREVPKDKVLQEEEGWAFRGYGICLGYVTDDEAKPAGKWLWMHFASLDTFPPGAQVLKLQPPHVVKGRFQNAERTHEIRMIKVSVKNAIGMPVNITSKQSEPENKIEEKQVQNKIVQFRKKKV